MEPYIEEQDTFEEEEYYARCEERRRIRLERQKRRRRQRMLKRCLYLVLLVSVLVTIVVVGKGRGRRPAEEPLLQAQEEAVEEAVEPEAAEETEKEPAEREEDVPEKENPVYRFTTTPDTVGIYSENVISTHALLVDADRDVIVASKGADERIYPASMTKVLTVLVAAEQITEEDLDDTFIMTREITDYAYVNDCSSVGFLDGESVKVRDLFYGTVMPSGGDAALGLATYIAGSQEAFVERMNEKLKELGIGDSAHFTNCIGLYDDAHYCTVYDMAVIMKAAVQNELCREVMSAHTYTTASTAEHPEGISISNWFLRKIEDKDTGGEVLCAKTGYVVQSMNCAVSYSISTDETPYICVTTGSTSGWRCIYDHVEIYNEYVPTGTGNSSQTT